MADNFNLRSFLSENKLTKNAQLLKEQQEDYKYFDEEGVGGFYLGQVKGITIYSLEDSSVMDTCMYALEGPQGVDFIDIDVAGEPISPPEILKQHQLPFEIAQFIADDIDRELGEEGIYDEEEEEEELNEAKEYSFIFNYNTDEDDVEYIQNILMNAGVDAIAEPGIDSEEMVVKALNAVELRRARKAVEADGFEVNENIDEASYSDSYDTPAAKKVHGQLRDIVNIFDKSRSEEEQEVEAAIQAAEQETGSQVTPTEKSVLLQQARWIRTHDMEMERESVDNKKPIMKETNLTAKERRLVEMVNNAMGFSEGEENVDYTMGRQDDPNQLPNPAPELNIPEGDEMGDETVIPEYNTIDELMNSIDHGTNKVAEEHKMQEMKKIAQMLREKAKKMEESEHAAHISPKDLKQLATDAAKLEKAAEKLKAAFDKKFNKKEKPAAAPKAEKVEALQEGTFDLRKFLTENKLTANSKQPVHELFGLGGPKAKYKVDQQVKVKSAKGKPEGSEDLMRISKIVAANPNGPNTSVYLGEPTFGSNSSTTKGSNLKQYEFNDSQVIG